MASYVVTGGSSGIGLAIAQRLAADGHELVLVARRPEPLEQAAEQLRAGGAQCAAAALDVRNSAAVDELISGLDRVDGVVNNAAGNFACPTVDLSDNAFRAVVEISLYGAFYFSRALARRLIAKQHPGTILNIVATYAWTGAPSVAHSASAKAGMLAFTKSVAREWAPHGIRVNALAPGFVPTDNARAGLLSAPDAEERMLSHIPLGRFATADEIAESAAFLMGEGAAYVTGAVLTVDGGRSLGTSMYQAAGARQLAER